MQAFSDECYFYGHELKFGRNIGNCASETVETRWLLKSLGVNFFPNALFFLSNVVKLKTRSTLRICKEIKCRIFAVRKNIVSLR